MTRTRTDSLDSSPGKADRMPRPEAMVQPGASLAGSG